MLFFGGLGFQARGLDWRTVGLVVASRRVLHSGRAIMKGFVSGIRGCKRGRKASTKRCSTVDIGCARLPFSMIDLDYKAKVHENGNHGAFPLISIVNPTKVQSPM